MPLAFRPHVEATHLIRFRRDLDESDATQRHQWGNAVVHAVDDAGHRKRHA